MLIENQLKKLGFGTAALFLLIVAVLLNAPQMYLMAIIVALVPVAGWALNRLLSRGLICKRSSADTADENGRMLVTVTVENRGLFPKFFLRVADSLPRFLRYAGSPSDEPVFITRLWPGEVNRVLYYIEPHKRGVHRIGPLTIQSTDIFGFSNLRTLIPIYDEVLVYPEVLAVSPNLLSSGIATGWRDEQDARSCGNGTDFTGVRDYRPGDELRRINWKTTARTGSLAVTEFTQGYASDIVVLLDRQAAAYANSGEGQISAFEYGIKIASSLAASAMRRGSKVQVSSAATGDDALLELHGEADLPNLLERLARIEADGRVSLGDQLAQCAREVRSGVIAVVITPRSPDDPDLRAELESWARPPMTASLCLFWLDNESFAQAQEEAKAGRFVSVRGYATGRSFGRQSLIGHEYRVGANTNLLTLLGGPIVG